MSRPVVVGVDGSEQSHAAAHYAARLARRHHAPLRLVFVFESLFYGFGPMFVAGSYGMADEQLREAAQKTLDEVSGQVRAAHPDLEISSHMREGGAAAALIAESQEAEATVVGTRGVGGFAELMLGSVSAQVASHGHGVIVVARPEPEPAGPVLAGFDGSEQATAALDYAVREALTLGGALVVANVYWPEPWGFGEEPAQDPLVTAAHEAAALIERAVEPYRRKHPELAIESRTMHGLNPEHDLIQESAHARLTVVGSRGRGGFAGLLLGSVSRTLAHHAAGPVAIVHVK